MERRGGSAEKQEWDEGRRFGGRIVVEKKEEALRTAKGWSRPDMVCADESRQEDGAVGTACVWRSSGEEGGWTGRRFQLGINKEVFDAEVFPVWQALRALGQRNERDREYTIFVESTSDITRVRDDARGPGQRFGVAAIEVETRRAAAGTGPPSAGYRLTLVPREMRWPTSTRRTPPPAGPLERDCQRGMRMRRP